MTASVLWGRAAVWAVLGVALAAAYCAAGRRLPPRAARWWWWTGLVVAALVYVAFAVERSAPGLAVGLEVGGVVAYGALGALGLRGDVRWLGAAWLLHGLWDLGLHAPGGPALAPLWYVVLCLAFDVVVGTYLLAAARWDRRGAVLDDARW